jgi:catechol 2,3-dioxygenase-like lactoylglutathione lyase family enzyme
MPPAIAAVAPILPVRDLARAVDFYRCLGFTAHTWQNGDAYAFIQRDGHEFHLSRSDKLTGNQSPAAVYFYLVKGTAAALESEFRAAGVEILSPLAPRPWKMKDFTISDPDGTLLHFGEDIS